MAEVDKTPTFNMKAVVQETGVKPDTLRAWERRYGLPNPQRTPGGHRLYSQRDIDIIRWLITRQREGLNISNAVDLWHNLVTEGQDPLQAAEYALPQSADAVSMAPTAETISGLRQAWVFACMRFDERGAESAVTQAFALFPPETVCLELLQKGLASLGEAWYHGEATVQQEHFASELAVRRLETLVAAASPPTRSGRILIGCPPEEAHAFAPLLLTFLLRRRGWEALYLGADVPVARLDSTVATTRPRLVVLSAQQLHTAATLLEMAQLLQREDVPLAFGGLVFNTLPALRSRIPGHFLGEHLDLAPQVVEQLLTSSHPLPRGEGVPAAYQEALVHYQDRRLALEADLLEAVKPAEMPQAYLDIANANLARNITAALILGDMKFLDADIAWLQELLSNYGLPAAKLLRYLHAFYRAAESHLDERGRPIVDWLARYAGAAS